MNNEIKHSLLDIHTNLSCFQIFNNKLSQVDCVSQRVFEKLIRKNVKYYFFICNVEKFVKMLKKLVFIQWIIEHLKLNKILSFDLLKIFKNDLLNQLSSIKVIKL